ncbi:hypothetical protein [Tautonia sociabilis]|uniref:hypothetical protein n=1 Tax=Tautonia sociabilis TaxID=2080755 RepID=UPI001315560A|nr:hypothetical protein [Tautonia sociabilis]
MEKVEHCFEAGVGLVWVVDPRRRIGLVFEGFDRPAADPSCSRQRARPCSGRL